MKSLVPTESTAEKEGNARYLHAVRQNTASRTAIVFVHGFGGQLSETWGGFPGFLAADPRLDGWDIFSLGYATSLRLDVPLIWAADPPLKRLSLSVVSALSTSPLARYRSIAIVAHSMGGLIAQDAILDRRIGGRVGHLILFGTPSAGLYSSALLAPLKRQVWDMFPFGPFILSLRVRWWLRFNKNLPFELRVVAGERDEFVPPRSSLSPFRKGLHRVVPGDHVAIVKPTSESDRSVQLVIDAICGESRDPEQIEIDSALAALERRDFEEAIAVLLPRFQSGTSLDDAALVALSLALESVGRSEEANEVIEGAASGSTSAELQGVLAGRVKRRWLRGRSRHDWQRAVDLYSLGLSRADPSDAASAAENRPVTLVSPWFLDIPMIVSGVDAEQSMYHAINLAFLHLLNSPDSATTPEHAIRYAGRTLWYSGFAKHDHWRAASRGEAFMILGDLGSATASYSEARHLASKPREIDSMYQQAVRTAARLFGVHGVQQVVGAFKVVSPPA